METLHKLIERNVWKKYLLHLLILLAMAAGILKYADEILVVKKNLYSVLIAIKESETVKSDELALYEGFPAIAGGVDEWYLTTQVIMHAGGGIDGITYTNAREAVEASLSQGNQVIEIDFLFTSDGHLICGHDWDFLWALEPVTLEDFLDIGIFRKYTPMTGENVVALMGENPELRIVLDTKEASLVPVVKELLQLANGDPDIMGRFIIQLYDRGEKQEIMEIYSFERENFLFTAYKLGEICAAEIMGICYEEDIQVVTIPCYAWEEEILRFFREKGIVIFEHTVNDPEEARSLLEQGVQGVYTDFLTEADLLAEE